MPETPGIPALTEAKAAPDRQAAAATRRGIRDALLAAMHGGYPDPSCGGRPLPFNGYPPRFNFPLGPDDTVTTGPSPFAGMPVTDLFPADPQAPTPPMLPPHIVTPAATPVRSIDPEATPAPPAGSSAPFIPSHGTTGGHGRVHGRDYGSARTRGILKRGLRRGS